MIDSHKQNLEYPAHIADSVTVVIVNWNCADVLGKCIDHLLKQSLVPGLILIMDNGSQDDSLSLLPANHRIRVCRLNSNLGFAAANNRALFECTTEYIALLNPDAFPATDWLENLLSAARINPDVVAFGSLQLCAENPDLIDGAGDIYHVSGLVWRDRHRTAVMPSDKLDNKPIFSPCAAAALYRRQLLIDIGGFDEDFFCYIEDIDLGFRLQLAGHKALLVANAVVRHVGSASTGGQSSNFCVYQGHRNLVWAYIKNMPGFLIWLFLPLHLGLNLFSLCYFAIKGQGRIILRAKIDACKGIQKMWQKRKIIQTQRSASTLEILKMLNKGFIFNKNKQHS